MDTVLDMARTIGDFSAPSGAGTTDREGHITREVATSAETSPLLRKRGSTTCLPRCSESIQAEVKTVAIAGDRMAEAAVLAGGRMAEVPEVVDLEAAHDAPNAFWSRAICAGSFSI